MIVFIYEGPKAEYNVFNNIKKVFFPQKQVSEVVLDDVTQGIEVIDGAYGGNIYDFYNAIKDDEDIDIIALIQERIKNNREMLKKYGDFLKYTRDDVAEVYLFFDFDIHHNLYNKKDSEREFVEEFFEKADILKAMLNRFSDETASGKLYINYPMVESLKDIKKDTQCFHRCRVSVENLANYKNDVHRAQKDFVDFRKFTSEEWIILKKHASRKANCIINGTYEIPSYKIFIYELNQQDIFDEQIYGCEHTGEVFVLSSIPLFLLEYFGEKVWNNELLCE